ncbi:MAG: glycosyltransferase family 1 protein [Burkholderiaceae bacterium]
MPEIIIDVSRLVSRRIRKRLPTGIDRVGLAYIRYYLNRASAALCVGDRAMILPPTQSRRLFEELLADSDGDASGFLRVVAAGIARAPFPALRTSLRSETTGRWFLNTGHTGLDRPAYEEMLSALGVRPLYVIHDLIPITHPQYCRRSEGVHHVARITRALKTGAAVVCNSRSTADILAGFAGRIGSSLPPMTVAPLGAEQPDALRLAQIRERPPIEDAYFLMLGTIEPRKNHLLMLQVWQRLMAIHGARTPKLVLIGQRGWECEHVERMLERAPGLRDVVLRPERCGDRSLQAWIAHARALLFPSFAEGFGLPVIEALQLGVPVIASDLPVYREFAGSLPEYLDPLDAAGWLVAIDDYAASDSRRRAQRLRTLAGYRAPTWAEHFTRVDALMHRAGGKTTPRSASSDALAVPEIAVDA